MRVPAWTDRVLWRRRKLHYKLGADLKKHVRARPKGEGESELLLGTEENFQEGRGDDEEEEEGEEEESMQKGRGVCRGGARG